MKNQETQTRLLNLASLVLMLILFLMQFMPFWGNTSVFEYIWFPRDHAEVTSSLQASLGSDFAVMQIVLAPALQMVLLIVGIIFFLWQGSSPFVAVIPAACGLISVVQYLTQPAFQLGSNWVLPLILSILILAVAVFTLIAHFAAQKQPE